MPSVSDRHRKPHTLESLGEELRYVSTALWRSVPPSARWQMGGVLVLVVLGSAFQAFSPLALKAMIDGLGAGPTAVALPVLAYAVLIGAARLGPSIAGWGYQVSARRVERALSLRAYARLLDLPHAFFLRHRSGEMGRTVSDGVGGSTTILGALLFSALPFVVEVGIAFAVLAASSFPWSITLVLAAFVIGYGIVFEKGIAGQREAYRDAARDNAEAAGIAHDAFANHEAIKLFARERYVLDHVVSGMARSDVHWSRFARLIGVTGAAQGLVVAAAMGCTLLLAGREVAAGRLTAGDFVLVNAYVLQVMGPVERLGHLIREVMRGLDMAGRLRRLLAEPSEGELSLGRAALPPGGALSVQVRHLRFSYDAESEVLQGIDLDIPAGRTLAVVGRSGSGKSTLARLFLRLYAADGGWIALDGVPVEELDLQALRTAIAIVPQETVLLHDTLRRNVAFGQPDASPDEIEAAARTAGLDRVVASLPEGWETVVGERGLRLSGGERQRVAIARALLKKPRLLVLDEATASLDTRTEREVQARLDLLARGTTTLVIAHRLSTIRQADEIVVLDHGVIVERGGHDQLLQHEGLYASLWRAQIEAEEAIAPESEAAGSAETS
jgi:ABC-type multidrug transport system fused ATPase/permease subunit